MQAVQRTEWRVNDGNDLLISRMHSLRKLNDARKRKGATKAERQLAAFALDACGEVEADIVLVLICALPIRLFSAG